MGYLFNRINNTFIYPINKTVDAVMSASNGLLCLASGLFGAGSNLSASTILGALGSIASGLIASILNSVTSLILRRVDQVIGSALSPIKHIRMLINDLTGSLKSLQSLINKATTLDGYISNRQNCSNMGANVLNCLIQSTINNITNKVVMNVDKKLAPIVDKVSKESFKTNGAIYSHVNRNTEFLNKAKLQQKLMI